jgi:hypothetical protein
MDGKYEGVSGEALEREIEAALGVDPSSEFLPRVRARIASERMHDGGLWSASWQWAGAVTAVAGVVVIAVWGLRDPAPASREVRNAPAAEVTAPSIERARPEPPRAPALVEARRNVSAPAVRRASSEPRPTIVTPIDVLISPDEAAALKQLFAAIGNRRIEASALPDLQSALRPPAPIEEIALDPITISPLAPLEGE